MADELVNTTKVAGQSRSFTGNNNNTESFLDTSVTQIPWNSPMNIAICSIGLLLNTIEISILLNKLKKLSIFELYLLSLAITDGIVLAAIIIFEGMVSNSPRYTNAGNLGSTYGLDLKSEVPVLRLAIETVKRFSADSSAMMLLTLGFDRLMAVKYPIKHRVCMTKKRAFKIIMFDLLLALLFALLELTLSVTIGYEVKEYWSIVEACLVVFAVSVLTILYSLIIYNLVKRPKTVRKNSSKTNKRNAKCKETEVIVTCCLVVLAYDACMLPFALEILLKLSYKSFNLVFMGLYLNSVINPLLYFFKGFLGRQLKKGKRRKLEDKKDISSSDKNFTELRHESRGTRIGIRV